MTFQFKIQIQNITKPPVWRRVVVPSETTFSMLHTIIQEAFGWYDAHMYSFSPTGYGSIPWIEEEDYDEEENDDEEDIDDDFDKILAFALSITNSSNEQKSSPKLKLSNIFKKKGQTFTYIYDFGDDWIHKITLEEIDKYNISSQPKLIAGKGACPPEDCGGSWGYEHLKEVAADKNHPEYQELKEWLHPGDEDDLFGEDEAIWDPSEYDLEIEKEMFDDMF